ncbi:sorting nexin-29-like [Arctopsyche grandis]|uniref:sorting nexin-29-like n=1 Tax=Arctopsyche grandis TaxID=121162 RepID=UPI00406D7690
MEIEHLKTIGQKLISAVVPGPPNPCNIVDAQTDGFARLKALENAVSQCQTIFGGKTILATDENIHVVDMCNQWVNVFSHGLKIPVSTYQPLQNIITAGLNFAFNLNLFDVSLWDYARVHLTRHEEERFKLLKNINTPIGHFRAFLRSALNERSLDRYLRSWINNILITEYYEDWAIIKNPEVSTRLSDLAAGLTSILFAMPIDKSELNEPISLIIQTNTTAEPVIAISAPIAKNTNKKTLRQVISFDSVEERRLSDLIPPINITHPYINDNVWNSAPPTCENSPNPTQSMSGSSVSNNEIKDVFFREDSIDFSEQNLKDSPREILSRLTEKAKDIFSMKKQYDSISHHGSDLSSTSGDKKLSESDLEEGILQSRISRLELAFPGEELLEINEGSMEDSFSKQRNQHFPAEHVDKICQMEQKITSLTSENERLKEQLKLNKDDLGSEEIKQYETKLVQVAQMHAELMEFNNLLQQQLKVQNVAAHSGYAGFVSNHINILIPSTYFVSKGSKSFHVYQVFLKIRSEEWNVYRRYSEFRKFYYDLKNTHPNVSSFKFPPKKILGKKEAWLVEQRRSQLQAWLKHILDTLPQVQQCTKRAELVSLLPFFGEAGYSENSGTLRPIVST